MSGRCDEQFNRPALEPRPDLRVKLAVYVSADGHAKRFGVLESSGVRELDLSAMRCVDAGGTLEPASLPPDATGAWRRRIWN